MLIYQPIFYVFYVVLAYFSNETSPVTNSPRELPQQQFTQSLISPTAIYPITNFPNSNLLCVTGFGNPALPVGFPIKVNPLHLKFFKGKEHHRDLTEFPIQNLRQISPEVHKL